MAALEKAVQSIFVIIGCSEGYLETLTAHRCLSHRPSGCCACAGKPSKSKSRLGRSRPASQDLLDTDADLAADTGDDPLFDPASEAQPVSRPHQAAPRPQGRLASSNLVKKYGALFIWGQLSGWFKQTVYDPTASLSAERRGTLSLPDPDSCYGSGRQYSMKVL